VGDVGETSNVVVTLLDDNKSEDSEVHADDAAADGLALALTGAARAVAGVTLRKQELNTGRVHNTLLHGETLLVVSSSDLEDIASELGSDAVTRNLLTHALVHEDTEAALVLNLDELLGAIGGVSVRSRFVRYNVEKKLRYHASIVCFVCTSKSSICTTGCNRVINSRASGSTRGAIEL
jgi:hypothetical protein